MTEPARRVENRSTSEVRRQGYPPGQAGMRGADESTCGPGNSLQVEGLRLEPGCGARKPQNHPLSPVVDHHEAAWGLVAGHAEELVGVDAVALEGA